MSNQSDYMLGRCFALLAQLRNHLILAGDNESISLIENEYQDLKNDMELHYYGHLKEKKND
jgi:hypothetical protein